MCVLSYRACNRESAVACMCPPFFVDLPLPLPSFRIFTADVSSRSPGMTQQRQHAQLADWLNAASDENISIWPTTLVNILHMSLLSGDFHTAEVSTFIP